MTPGLPHSGSKSQSGADGRIDATAAPDAKGRWMNSRMKASLPAAIVLLGMAAWFSGCGGGEVPATDAPPAPEPPLTEEPAPEVAEAPARAVLAERLPYAEVGEQLVYGYFTFPEDMIEPLPAVVLIHDWWGLNDDVRELAKRLAGAGYIVLAVDLFGGETASAPSQARTLELAVAEDAEAAYENLAGAYRFLRDTADAPAVGVFGLGFGGGWSLNALIERPQSFSVCVIYYGQVTNDQELLAPVTAPLLGQFAADDRAIPVERVRDFEVALEALDKDYEIVVYENARRGFADSGAENYDPRLARTAWDRTLAFLDARLASTAE